MNNKLNSILQKYQFVILGFLFFWGSAFWLRTSLPDSQLLFNLTYSFLNAIILLSLIILISKIPKFSWLFLLLLSLLVTADITHKLVYGTVLSIGGISSMFETNTTEAGDFLFLYIKEWFLTFIFTTAIITLITLRSSKLQIRSIYPFSAVILIFLLLLVSIVGSRNKVEKARAWEEFNISPELFIQTNISTRVPLGINAFISSFSYWNEMRKFRKEASSPKNLMPGLSYSRGHNSPQTIFFVIGESSIRSHYSLYGYDIPTTPFLDSMKVAGKLLAYKGISVAPITREALRMTLSFASPLDNTPFFKNENIVTMANMAGYDSYWISNQDKVGMSDSFTGLFASYTKQSIFYRFDMDDLDLLDDVKKLFDISRKQIFFIHLRGSHLDYKDKFDDIDAKALNQWRYRGEVINYDRSIYHTNRVLAELTRFMQISATNNTSAAIIYFSDHGEIINRGHGVMDETNEQFKIPFIIIPHNFSGSSKIIEPYIIDGVLNSNSITYIASLFLGYNVDSILENKARNEAGYYYHVDGKSYPIKNLCQ